MSYGFIHILNQTCDFINQIPFSSYKSNAWFRSIPLLIDQIRPKTFASEKGLSIFLTFFPRIWATFSNPKTRVWIVWDDPPDWLVQDQYWCSFAWLFKPCRRRWCYQRTYKQLGWRLLNKIWYLLMKKGWAPILVTGCKNGPELWYLKHNNVGVLSS